MRARLLGRVTASLVAVGAVSAVLAPIVLCRVVTRPAGFLRSWRRRAKVNVAADRDRAPLRCTGFAAPRSLTCGTPCTEEGASIPTGEREAAGRLPDGAP